MSVEKDQLQLVMLRILGVLLIAVGFTMIAGSAQSSSERSGSIARSIAVQVFERSDRCERPRVEVRSVEAPRPPKTPRAPKSPSPPSPPAFVFVN